MAQCLEYRPEHVAIKVAGRTIFCWNDASAERAEDEWETVAATSGCSSFKHNPRKDGIISVTIHQEGIEDVAFIRQLAQTGELFNVIIVDNSGTQDSAIGHKAHVVRQPNLERSNDDVTYEVQFAVCNLVFSPTVNTPASDIQATTV